MQPLVTALSVRDCRVTLRGIPFHYRDWARSRRAGRQRTKTSARSPSSQATIVMLHGLASQSHIFDFVAPLLANEFRVLALDQRGHGESGKPEGGYDLPNIADDLLAFLDSQKIKRAVIVGHSWGGNVALQFAIEHSDRTAALVLLDGGFLDLQSDPRMTWENVRARLAPPRLAGTPLSTFKEMLEEHVNVARKRAAKVIILENFEQLPDGTIRPHLSYDNHMKVLRGMWEQRSSLLLPELTVPVLLIPAQAAASGDRELAFLQAKRRALADAGRIRAPHRVIWFKNTIHDIPLQRPRRLANVIARFVETIE